MNAAGLAMVEADSLATVRGHSVYSLVAPEYRQAFMEFNEAVCEGKGGNLEFEIIGLRDTRRWMDTHAVPFYYEHLGETVHLAITRDITARKKAEETLRQVEGQLRQSQKMEEFGRLSGGVAHDFNNLLTVILGFNELTANALPKDHPTQVFLAEVARSSERGASLTRQLLAFSRRQVLESKKLELNAVVTNMKDLLCRLIGEDIALSTVLDANLGAIEGDVGQIEQVVMNLAINARDAMPDGGKLIIESRNVELSEENRLTDPEFEPGSYVMLVIQDSGCGMDKTTIDQIFEPFFTTKAVGMGTGLGLSTVYGIVKQSGGFIEVESVLGQGTTFRIYLRRLAAEVPAKAAIADNGMTPRGNETVLVVEDDDAIRMIIRQILNHSGYTVLDAPDG